MSYVVRYLSPLLSKFAFSLWIKMNKTDFYCFGREILGSLHVLCEFRIVHSLKYNAIMPQCHTNTYTKYITSPISLKRW